MIHIYYRHYNNTNSKHITLSGRPVWFSYEKCFQNFLSTIKDIEKVSFTVIMDGSVSCDWLNNYQHIFENDSYNLIEIEAGSDALSAGFMYRYIKEWFEDGKIGDSDLIYLVENDYLHVENWVDDVIDLYNTYHNIQYISLYDHNDKYFPQYVDDMISRVYATNTHHWRTIPSTCGTYIAKADLLLEDIQDHINVVGDHNKWIYLSQTKQRFILTPIPGLSTHCMEGLMSPTIDWEEINNIVK
jgi:hypothetical protein